MNTLTTTRAALALAALASFTHARTAKEAPPAPGPARNFSVPAPKTFTLENGLTVTLVTYGNTPKADVVLYVAAGNSYEKANEVWLGDLTGQLMREGTTSKTGPEISRAAAQMGGQVDVGVGVDTANVAGSALS